MKRLNTIDNLVLKNLASLFNAQLNNFTFYASLPSLPNNYSTLVSCLDKIPTGNQFYKKTESVNFFSKIYGKILEAQIKKPIAIEIGLTNYKNPDNWVNNTIPKCQPTLSTIENKISKSQKGQVVLSSAQENIITPKYPEFPMLVADNLLVDFYKKVATNNFTTTISFNKQTNLLITYGNWFYSGAFLYAYQTPSNWNSNIISWEDVFNKETGVLKYLNTNIAVVSNMTIELHIEGVYTDVVIDALTNISNQVLFPFYEKINNAEINYILNADKTITIKLILPENNNYVFGMKYINVLDFLI